MRGGWESALAAAEAHLLKYPPDLQAAEAAFRAAHSRFPDDPNVAERLATFLAQFTPRDREAARLLKRTIRSSPTADRHFALAQLLHGREAEASYKKGIALLEAAELPSNDIEAGEIRRRLGQAYCAVGELYTTDLCDEEQARRLCLVNLQKAAELDSSAIPTQNALATFYYVTKDLPNARKAAEVCVELLRAEFGVDDLMDDLYSLKPLIQLRQAVVATLLNLEMTEEACEILHGALEEDDEDVHTWFLLSTSHLMAGRTESARKYFDRLTTLLEKSEYLCEWESKIGQLHADLHESMEEELRGG